MAEQQLPVWNSEGIEPPANLQIDGWQPGVKPPAQYFDWLFNRAYKCLEELQAITEALETNKANGEDLITLNNKVTQHLDDSKKWIKAMAIDQIIPNGAFTQVLSAEVVKYNGADFGNIVNSRLSLKKGVYLVFASVFYDQNANGVRRLALSEAGTTTNAVEGGLTFNNLATIVQINNDDTLLAVDAYQDSGNALIMRESTIKVIKVGDLT